MKINTSAFELVTRIQPGTVPDGEDMGKKQCQLFGEIYGWAGMVYRFASDTDQEQFFMTELATACAEDDAIREFLDRGLTDADAATCKRLSKAFTEWKPQSDEHAETINGQADTFRNCYRRWSQAFAHASQRNGAVRVTVKPE